MTDAQPPHDHQESHEGPIKTPKQLVLAVLFAFVLPIAIIVLLVEFVTNEPRPMAGANDSAQTVDERIAPVAKVDVKDVSDLSTLKTGEQVFQAQCTTCHTAGALGAPKFGDSAAWAPRIATGFDALLNSALHGKGNMPAQGGGDFTDFEVARAVVYMADKAGANFPEPAQPAAGASAPVAAMAAAPSTGASEPMAVAAAASEPAATAPAAATASAATVIAAAAPAPAPAADSNAVPALYTQVCQVCHASGVAGAPKLGDKAAWAPRIAEAKDIDGLVAVAIKGKGAMPPRGGSQATDAEIKAVVTYMVNQAK